MPPTRATSRSTCGREQARRSPSTSVLPSGETTREPRISRRARRSIRDRPDPCGDAGAPPVPYVRPPPACCPAPAMEVGDRILDRTAGCSRLAVARQISAKFRQPVWFSTAASSDLQRPAVEWVLRLLAGHVVGGDRVHAVGLVAICCRCCQVPTPRGPPSAGGSPGSGRLRLRRRRSGCRSNRPCLIWSVASSCSRSAGPSTEAANPRADAVHARTPAHRVPAVEVRITHRNRVLNPVGRAQRPADRASAKIGDAGAPPSSRRR